MKEPAIEFEFDDFDDVELFKKKNEEYLKEYDVHVNMNEEHTMWIVSLTYKDEKL